MQVLDLDLELEPLLVLLVVLTCWEVLVVPSWLEVPEVPFWLEVLVPLVPQVPQVWQVLTDTPVPGTAPGTVPGTATAGTATAASWPTPTEPSSPPPATPPNSATPVWCPTLTELLSPLSLRMLWPHARSTWLPSLKKKEMLPTVAEET